MKHSINHAILSPELNLSAELLSKLQHAIEHGNIVTSMFKQGPDLAKNKQEQEIFKKHFGQGYFQVYRLSIELEEEIRYFYRDFLSHVPVPAKIRIKSSQNLNSLVPHSDARDGGDKSSLTVVIISNGETTNWYNAGPEWEMTEQSIQDLELQTRLCLGDGHACLFNNSAVHSVTNCDPNKKRFVLTIGWQDLEFESLVDGWTNWRKQ